MTKSSTTRSPHTSTSKPNRPTTSKSPVPSPSKILQLQKTLGNQAVMQMMRGKANKPHHAKTNISSQTKPIQRDLENETYNSMDGDLIKQAKQFFASYNKAVKAAYDFVVSVPSLGAYKALDGHTKKWAEDWQKVLDGEPASLLSASFGYVIESLVSHGSSDFRPSDPSGCTVLTQVVHGGTRPDLVLWNDDLEDEIAWLDVTASNSADHILKKDNWEERIAIFAEVTYDSLTEGTLGVMKSNKNNTSVLSEKDLKERIKQEQEIYDHKKHIWTLIGKEFTVKSLSKEIGRSKDEQNLDPSIRQDFIHSELESFFGTTINMKLVPSILVAMGVNATSWFFYSGFSVNERTGDTWLNKHVPSFYYD
ncbi:hypothetical protein JJB07_12370 [Tumebacillus sp. ITR2]|uniref:Uncharacterized protein n=1 Tax=Tumebacillus amylolyticus TaxID=2801339 RepID=A0ABS1JCT8_9BACL|nr:hypothetical protein [Tumebacillus amylolyticus]MBL0387448.1 hypothetical protein [Tumebacillus amylolyticus]